MRQPWPPFAGMAIAVKTASYTVFQCLSHTLNWPAPRWRVLDVAHQKRNLAEYEGFLEVEESTITELGIRPDRRRGQAGRITRQICPMPPSP